MNLPTSLLLENIKASQLGKQKPGNVMIARAPWHLGKGRVYKTLAMKCGTFSSDKLSC